MCKKAMTLIELILALMLMSGILIVVSASLVFFVNQIQANLQRSNIYTQMGYAMDDMKMRTVSAVALGSYFDNDGDSKTELVFHGESNIYNVTLNTLADNSWYKYYVVNNNLVLKTCADSSCVAGNEEILVEAKFTPGVTFYYDLNTAPNLLRVVLTANSTKIPLGGSNPVRSEGGIRFWFLDAAQ